MWEINVDGKAIPYINQLNQKPPTHDRPTQSLPKLWVQNASLEIVKLKAILETDTISGSSVLGFEMPGLEGFDINNQSDFEFLEYLIKSNHDLIE